MVPGWYGMAHVKWLRRITARTAPFDGFQQTVGYRFARAEDEPGEPVTRIAAARADESRPASPTSCPARFVAARPLG